MASGQATFSAGWRTVANVAKQRVAFVQSLLCMRTKLRMLM